MRRALLLATVFSVAAIPTLTATAQPRAAATAPAVTYPQTTRGDVVEEQFGVRVADPYRWLEDDVRNNPAVRDWVTAQNQVSSAFLERLPHRAAFRARMSQLYDYERFSVPQKAGSHYFYTRNDGLQNQSVLYVRDGLNGTPRLLIDPNIWAQDGATALGQWEPSKDGRYVAYGVQEGGTDWRVLKVIDTATGRVLDDEVRWAKFTGIEWAKDGSGFYYSRFPEPAGDQQFQSLNENHAIYFHRIGTAQSADRPIFAQPERPRLSNNGEVTDDGNWLIVYSNEGTDDAVEVTLVDLRNPQAAPRRIMPRADASWSYLGNRGSTFYWQTNKDAPRQRIVSMDIARPETLTQIVGEDEATLQGASIVGERLILSYLADAKSDIRTFDLRGQRTGSIRLPGIGSAAGFSGDMDSTETFYSFASFNSPGAIYRYDARTGASSVFAEPELAFDPAQYEVRQVFYNSKDGTRVPMFLVHRKDLNLRQPQPTLLYGYGGFNANELPRYQPKWMTWVDSGGVLAVANLRGGGEYGKAWHDAGRLANKQNTFDDFIAAGEYLIAQRITTNRQLAVEGRSNGGLLIGAVVNQRPDLFAAALPTVGVMDMLRFDRFTAGRYWVDDYGYPNREPDFRTLWSYSPYHNIRANVRYPATLVTTADTDDRVVPGHSFKYIAALQHADPNGQPHLIRIETRAGHGSGKPTDKQIEEYSDMYAFIAHFTGMAVPTARPAPPQGERG